MADDIAVLRAIYNCFNARDIDGVLDALTDDVAWASWGLTRFLKIRSDLPVGLICRSSKPGFDLPWRANQSVSTVPE